MHAALEGVLFRTSMYVPVVTFDAVVSFFQGFDCAAEGGVLVGFREYLVPLVGVESECAWFVLIRQLAGRSGVPESDQALIGFLASTFAEFVRVRCDFGGLEEIYCNYRQWRSTRRSADIG